MKTNMPVSTEKEFVFIFTSKGVKSTLKAPVTLPMEAPLPTSIKSLAGRLISAHNLPCYVHEELTKCLEKFTMEETSKLYDSNGDEAVMAVKNGDVDTEKLIQQWTKAYKQGVKAYAPPEEESSDLLFSEVYHTLIHSPALETLFNLEHQYAMQVEDVTRSRDRDMKHLEAKQNKEMDEAVKGAGVTYTDTEINQLAQRHFENTQKTEDRWSHEVENLHQTQKQEYKEWVMKVYEDTSNNSQGAPSYVQKVRALSNPGGQGAGSAENEHIIMPEPRLEESFTIHLGAQLKTMHNLRLLCADVLDLCKHRANKVGGAIVPQPQRLQTAMSLYSNSLNGLIMLVDNRLNYYTGIKRDFAKVCQQSTDFHFPGLAEQFKEIETQAVKANEYRQQKQMEEGDKMSIKSGSSGESQKDEKNLQPGDFYITKHSNLSEVHVVFHLVCDDNLRSTDISSRNPVILGIRNILKVCFKNDITTLTVPLLLAHEMSEEMTIQWCQKRAELVFKCVKGFMMEMATWGDKESRTIQFLVPKGLDENMFTSLSAMLPQIFRVNNPLVIKSS